MSINVATSGKIYLVSETEFCEILAHDLSCLFRRKWYSTLEEAKQFRIKSGKLASKILTFTENGGISFSSR